MKVIHKCNAIYFVIKVDYKNLWRLERVRRCFSESLTWSQDQVFWSFPSAVPTGFGGGRPEIPPIHTVIPDGSCLVLNLACPDKCIGAFSLEKFSKWCDFVNAEPAQWGGSILT